MQLMSWLLLPLLRQQRARAGAGSDCDAVVRASAVYWDGADAGVVLDKTATGARF